MQQKTLAKRADPITLVERYLCSWILFETRSHFVSSLLIRTHYKFVVRQSLLISFERRQLEDKRTSVKEKCIRQKLLVSQPTLNFTMLPYLLHPNERTCCTFLQVSDTIVLPRKRQQLLRASSAFKQVSCNKALSNLIKI